jgi:hypothetical protein
MAFGQIDPARLDGDALRQWYLRSPADIEADRQKAAAQAYDAFFGLPDPTAEDDARVARRPERSDNSGASQLIWTQVGPNQFRSERAPTNPAPAPAYQLAASVIPARGYVPIPGCINCHGPRLAPPAPTSPMPLPPMFNPRRGSSGGSTEADDEWSDKPQCNQQFVEDRKVCQRAQNYNCWANQMERLSYCNQTGQVGRPRLMFGGR